MIGLSTYPKPVALPGSALRQFVTVLVPCRNEEKRIALCLNSILDNDYPKDRQEILVLDGMSEDNTGEILREYADKDSRVRVIGNPRKDIPSAMNLGIENARGDTIIKMDAHSKFQRDHISKCVRYQEEYGAENVGGVARMSPGSNSAVAKAIVFALGHRFGSGNALTKVGAEKPTWSDSAAFGCFKKELFSRIGMFDERLKSSSDMDMNMRIQAAGGRILLVPDIVVDYFADSTLSAFRKHNFADGVWATYVLKFGSNAWSWRHWVPMMFVLSLLACLVLGIFFPIFLWMCLGIAGLYAVTSIAVSLQIALRKQNFTQFLLLPAVFAVRHFAHGFGGLFGLVLLGLPGVRWKGRRRMQG